MRDSKLLNKWCAVAYIGVFGAVRIDFKFMKDAGLKKGDKLLIANPSNLKESIPVILGEPLNPEHPNWWGVISLTKEIMERLGVKLTTNNEEHYVFIKRANPK